MYVYIYIYLSPNHQDTFDLKKAQEILDRDHYGLADIKVPRWVNPMGSHGMIGEWSNHGMVVGCMMHILGKTMENGGWKGRKGPDKGWKKWKIFFFLQRFGIKRFFFLYHSGARAKSRRKDNTRTESEIKIQDGFQIFKSARANLRTELSKGEPVETSVADISIQLAKMEIPREFTCLKLVTSTPFRMVNRLNRERNLR